MAENNSKPSPLPTPEQKEGFVREMFTRISPHYDRMNRIMDLGRDKSWRRYAATQALGSDLLARKDDPARVLDMATGTGDLAFELLKQQPPAIVVGLDFVPDMVKLARQKQAQIQHRQGQELLEHPPFWTVGDGLKLPFAEATFDAVVTGFAMRNVNDIPAAFAEMARVTRTGGRVACLEFTQPRTPLFRQLYDVYLYHMVPLVGRLVAGETSAYTYLPHSVGAFLSPEQIVEVMHQTGWRQARYRRLMLGTVAVHIGERA
jgi:demethylmenaquinone methyltransferase/2-methoxy-6-polyprenyl-1,4-benzoquinol methylase